MSSSPKTAYHAEAGVGTTREKPLPEIVPFPYDSIPENSLHHSMISLAAVGPAGDAGTENPGARESQARILGRQEGLAEARKTFEDQLVRERAGVAAALAAFTGDRAVYFEKVEGEVVQLALAMARQILHREAQLDPLLLAGIVRVALEKIDAATGVVLRLHPQNAPDWRRYLSTHLDPADQPEIVEDAAQPIDRCSLETSMGSTVIGVEVQLKQIEQGLMDLLAARPGASP